MDFYLHFPIPHSSVPRGRFAYRLIMNYSKEKRDSSKLIVRSLSGKICETKLKEKKNV